MADVSGPAGHRRIDAHAHLFAPAQRDARAEIAERDSGFAEIYADAAAKVATAGDLLAAMREAHLDGAVAAGFAFLHARDLHAQTEYLLEVANNSDGRIVALATVNPALDGWRTEAEAALAAGARGFGELRPGGQGWDPLGLAGRELCELAAATGSVLLWHTSEPVGHRYPGKAGGISPADLVNLAFEYPAVPMVAAHLGAGSAFYLLMPELKAAIEALYFDTAAASLLYHREAVARVVDLAGPDRVLFGSDFPLLSPARQLARIGGVLADEPVRNAVLGGNAGRLYFSSRAGEGPGVTNSGA
jgi:predicted TIM-barrel fold metal-dependent hydrolase